MNKKIKEIQKCCLKLFDKFIEVCNKHKLSWFVDGGTLLGAIREGKMIEWDDDIDIVMPRSDFNTLLSIGITEFKDEYFFQTTYTDNIFQLMIKLRLKNTVGMTRNEYYTNCQKGIFIDIFPLDYVSNVDKLKLLQKFAMSSKEIEFNQKLTRKQLIQNFNTYNQFFTLTSSLDSEKKYVAEVILYRYSRYQNFDMRISTNAYSKYTLMNFEGLKNKIRIPIGYDEILRKWYGDSYMMPMRENNLHGTTFYDTEHDISYYSNYKTVSFEEFCKSNNCTNF